jgi:hypothetical protein
MLEREVIEHTPEEIAAAARVIRDSLDPETGRLPRELFYAASLVVPRLTVELAILSFDKKQVLLTDREDDDPHFTGMSHLPGVMMVPADVTQGRYNDAVDNAAVRAIDELEGTHIDSLFRLTPKWVNPVPREGPRGVEVPIIYGAILFDEEPAVGKMFDIDDLPESIYEHHPPIIKAVQENLNIALATDLRII